MAEETEKRPGCGCGGHGHGKGNGGGCGCGGHGHAGREGQPVDSEGRINMGLRSAK